VSGPVPGVGDERRQQVGVVLHGEHVPRLRRTVEARQLDGEHAPEILEERDQPREVPAADADPVDEQEGRPGRSAAAGVQQHPVAADEPRRPGAGEVQRVEPLRRLRRHRRPAKRTTRVA
jgi:hypothetical protein